MVNPLCQRCKSPLTKARIEKRKRKCFRCEVAVRREGKRRAHDRAVESEDFTAADYWHLYEMQGGTCAIHTCRAKGKSKHLTVEHDHQCPMGHDPARWCRVCVRGLTCSMHNEWIGRTGDDPAIFDSLAAYLRNPPALEMLMDRMTVGDFRQTLATLHDEYRISWERGRKMLDLARGVGPSPRPVPDGTIVIRYIRIPRTTKELYEIVESAPRFTAEQAVDRLFEYGISERRAKTALNKAWENGEHKVSAAGGIVRITYHGRGAGMAYMFSVEV